MKSKFLMLAAAVSLGMMACNDANNGEASVGDSTSVVTSTTTDNTSVDLDVPATARTSFETKYPNASNVKWNRYKPDADRSTLEASDWRYNLDTSDYEVSFNWNGEDYYAWYNDGEWIRASSPMKDHSKLPAAVNTAIRNQFAGYTIVEVDKEHDKDRTTYEVDMEKGEDKMKVHFDENGKVVKKKGKVDGEKTKEKEEDKH